MATTNTPTEAKPIRATELATVDDLRQEMEDEHTAEPAPHRNRKEHHPVTRHLTLAEVCDELGVARSTFNDWRAKGRAPRCIKLPNGSLRVRRAELERWISSCEEGL